METDLETASQLVLIAGCYRCDHCGRDVERTQKTRRFRLCDECWAQVVPDFEGEAFTEEQRAAIGRYWEWYWQIERRKPARYRPPKARPATPSLRLADSLYPVCECGEQRAEFGHAAEERGLFGGPFMQYCPVCQAKKDVEAIMRMAGAIHPDWDDEEWLDLLYKSHREAFALAVLPDYWYELRRKRKPGA
jgi:hypothetical protein